MALLEIDGASKRFGATTAVDDVSLTVERGAFYALLGPSGCGKTTLLRMIAGFETPDSGRIVIDGIDVTGLPPYARPVNMMFQSYALFPHMDVAGNVAFGLRQERIDRRRIAARVSEMLALVQMSGYQRRRPHELSGGQRQRVALARALAKMPKLLVLDEPLAALDRKLRAETRLELTGIQERVGITFLVVTHDQEEALEHGQLRCRDGPRTRRADRRSGRDLRAPRIALCRRFCRRGEPVRRRADCRVQLPGARRSGAQRADPVALRHTSWSEGAAAALAVRPEKLVLSHAPPAGFAIAAAVSSIGYQGGGSIVHLATEQGMALKAYLPGAAAGSFGRGTPVWASWAPARRAWS